MEQKPKFNRTLSRLRIRRDRTGEERTQSGSIKIVVSDEELLPFSWRYPLTIPPNAKMSKVYREVVSNERALVPHKHNTKNS